MAENMSLVVFDPIRATVADTIKKDSCQEFDHTTEEGEKALRSWVYCVRQNRSDLEKVRVIAKADALAYGKNVDALAKELKTPYDKIISDRMKPLDEIEAKKRADVEAIIEARRVAEEKAEADRLAELKRREDEVAKKEAELQEKERIEREKKIAIDSAETARKDAEVKAMREKQEALEAVETAKVKAEQDKKDAIAKAEADKQAAVEAEKEKARKVEADRLADESEIKAKARVIAKVEAERVADVKHRQDVEALVYDRISDIVGDDTETTKRIVEAIINGEIEHVTINY